jgi:hypothetical protein
MKKLLFLFSFLFVVFTMQSQTVASSDVRQQQLSSGQISQTDYKDLIADQKDLTEMKALTEKGLQAIEKPGPWKGFFKPVSTVLPKTYSASLSATAATSEWLFRPSVTVTAYAIQFGPQAQSQSLSSVGTGISYGNFSQVNGQAYCNYSFNALLLTRINIGGQTSTTFGAALTGDVFNKIIGLGIGYINNKAMLLTTLSYSF